MAPCRSDSHPVRDAEAVLAHPFRSGKVLPSKGDRRISVCIPARNEAATVGPVVDAIVSTLTGTSRGVSPGRRGRGRRRRLHRPDRRAWPGRPGPRSSPAEARHGGKGQAMRTALEGHRRRPRRLRRRRRDQLRAPLRDRVARSSAVDDESLTLVKGFYQRPLHGIPGRRGSGHRADGQAR
jgi:hypothetical protein